MPSEPILHSVDPDTKLKVLLNDLIMVRCTLISGVPSIISTPSLDRVYPMTLFVSIIN